MSSPGRIAGEILSAASLDILLRDDLIRLEQPSVHRQMEIEEKCCGKGQKYTGHGEDLIFEQRGRLLSGINMGLF